MSGVTKLGPVTPDPDELNRRFVEDKWIKRHVDNIARLEAKVASQWEQHLKDTQPFRIENQNYSNERARLMKLMNQNDRKIRLSRERALNVYQPALALAKRQLAGRKRSIKERYVMQLLCKKREELNKALPINVYVPEQPEPPPETTT